MAAAARSQGDGDSKRRGPGKQVQRPGGKAGHGAGRRHAGGVLASVGLQVAARVLGLATRQLAWRRAAPRRQQQQRAWPGAAPTSTRVRQSVGPYACIACASMPCNLRPAAQPSQCVAGRGTLTGYPLRRAALTFGAAPLDLCLEIRHHAADRAGTDAAHHAHQRPRGHDARRDRLLQRDQRLLLAAVPAASADSGSPGACSLL